VYHYPSLTLSRYLKMYFNYGRGAYRFQHVRRLRRSGSLIQDTRFHARLPQLLGDALVPIPLRQRPAFLGLMVLWQAANLGGFLSDLVAHRLGRAGGAQNAARLIRFSGPGLIEPSRSSGSSPDAIRVQSKPSGQGVDPVDKPRPHNE